MIKISRSAVEQHLNCQRCFYLAYKHKIRPPSLPFTLNSAVDNLCKNEFDHYRAKAEPHPMFLEHGIGDAICPTKWMSGAIILKAYGMLTSLRAITLGELLIFGKAQWGLWWLMLNQLLKMCLTGHLFQMGVCKAIADN